MSKKKTPLSLHSQLLEMAETFDKLRAENQQMKLKLEEMSELFQQMYDIALLYCSQRTYLMTRYNELAGEGKAKEIIENAKGIIEGQLLTVEATYFGPKDGHNQL